MNEALGLIGQIGIVPVVALERAEDAVPLSLAMRQGGIPIIEITYRTAQAAKAISAVRAEVPDVLVGAGTVVTREQADSALRAGAQYAVSPGYDADLVRHCQDKGLPVIPGVSTASEIQKAVAAGLDVLKFFPAEPLGGLPAIEFLGAPFGQVRFLPAGGVVLSNLGAYLASPRVFACGGGFMCRAALIEKGDWDGVTALCEQAVAASHGFELAHVGVNFPDADAARGAARMLADMFGLAAKEGNGSIFAGERIELMKTPFWGTNGHLGFAVNSVERAIPFLEKKGFAMRGGSLREGKGGVLQSCYLETEVGGFAVHVVRRQK